MCKLLDFRIPNSRIEFSHLVQAIAKIHFKFGNVAFPPLPEILEYLWKGAFCFPLRMVDSTHFTTSCLGIKRK